MQLLSGQPVCVLAGAHTHTHTRPRNQQKYVHGSNLFTISAQLNPISLPHLAWPPHNPTNSLMLSVLTLSLSRSRLNPAPAPVHARASLVAGPRGKDGALKQQLLICDAPRANLPCSIYNLLSESFRHVFRFDVQDAR